MCIGMYKFNNLIHVAVAASEIEVMRATRPHFSPPPPFNCGLFGGGAVCLCEGVYFAPYLWMDVVGVVGGFSELVV